MEALTLVIHLERRGPRSMAQLLEDFHVPEAVLRNTISASGRITCRIDGGTWVDAGPYWKWVGGTAVYLPGDPSRLYGGKNA